MSRTIILYQVDVFTRNLFKGNPAGVVIGANQLTPSEMQAIARELNNSETAFLFEPEPGEPDLRIRYFTPTMEVPSCGHATIAAHYVRATEQALEPGEYWHKIGIGRLPVEISYEDLDYSVAMIQAPPVVDPPISDDARARLLGHLGLTKDVLSRDLPIVRVDTGHSKIMVCVQSRKALNEIRPDFDCLAVIGKELNCSGFFIFTLQDPDPGITAHCRMFAPQIGINEDPVTGNGNGPLGVYLEKFGVLTMTDGELSFESRQGEACGRPGTAEVTVFTASDGSTSVKVRGNAVIAFRAELTLDD